MTTQVEFSRLHTNARALTGLESATDAATLSDDRLLCLHLALGASRHLVDEAVKQGQEHLRYGTWPKDTLTQPTGLRTSPWPMRRAV